MKRKEKQTEMEERRDKRNLIKYKPKEQQQQSVAGRKTKNMKKKKKRIGKRKREGRK